MDKVVKDGQVAVLYSPDYGAGWSTWNPDYDRDLIFEPAIVDMITAIDSDTHEWVSRAELYLTLKYPDMYIGDLTQLRVRWLPEGTQFYITEHEGRETLETHDSIPWITA